MPENPRPSLPYLLLGAVSYPVVRLLFRYRVQGLDRVPRAGGYVLAANHLSNFDPWPLAMALYPGRFLRFMAKAELFWFPLGPFARSCGAFPVKRGGRDTVAIETAVRLCSEGHVVVMFPEGTRRAKGMRKKYEARWHSGAARIALEAGVPLVPAGIAGTAGLSRLERLSVVYGDPIAVDDLGDVPLEEAADLATERLSAAIGELEAVLA